MRPHPDTPSVESTPDLVALKIAKLVTSASIAERLISHDVQRTAPRCKTPDKTAEPSFPRYTEEDIARIEAMGIGRLDTAAELMLAYDQNKPPHYPLFTLRGHRLGYDLGTDEELRTWAAEAEEVLKTSPKDYDARIKRLEALTGLTARDMARAERRQK